MGVINRLKYAWNTFKNRDPTFNYQNIGSGYSTRPDRPRLSRGNEKSLAATIYNRIALDAASIDILHAKLDEDGRFLSEVNSDLNRCLSVEANADQTGRAFRHDMFMSLLDEGSVAVVPVDTSADPALSDEYDILSLRTGKIIQWYPRHVLVRVYNENTGKQEDVKFEKRVVAVIENPLYAVVNEPNSTMQRLIKKLNLLDVIDEQSGSGKLDLIIQLPYTIRTVARKEQAELRRQDITNQLTGSKYGIAYTDSTERVTQLNRPIENNLMKQIEYLTAMMYSQLGLTQAVMDGSADEKTMLNYYMRTVEPLVSAATDEMKRKFLSRTALTQRQSILYFREPFKMVPVSDIAEIADKFTRNEIMTSNEIRQAIGMRPSSDPNADVLRNKNLNAPPETSPPPNGTQQAQTESPPLGDIPVADLQKGS
jgi:hypothetical protein